ncbi:MAG: hypothetical protein KDG44_06250 [Burkholderiaceae bacterium]|nr:hypothetical protein [Burkholderiaceae bacterium]
MRYRDRYRDRYRRRYAALGWLVAVAGISGNALADDRVPVQDARQLLIAAIDTPSGEAHGVLVGEIANAITQRFRGTTPIFIDVTTERRYTQAGCSRLKVRFWQDGVQLPGVPAPRRQTIDFGINYCRDGRPPKSLS